MVLLAFRWLVWTLIVVWVVMWAAPPVLYTMLVWVYAMMMSYTSSTRELLLETVPKKKQKTKTLYYNISMTAHRRICSRCHKENSRLVFTEMSAVLGRCKPFVGSRRYVPIRCRSMNQLRIRHYRIRRTGHRHHRHYRKSRVLRALRGGVVGSLHRWRSSRVVCWAPSAERWSGTGPKRSCRTTKLYRRSGRFYRERMAGWRPIWFSTGSTNAWGRACSSSL